MALTSYTVDEKQVALIRLEREAARNAINTQMLEEILQHLDRAKGDEQVRVDVHVFEAEADNPPGMDPDDRAGASGGVDRLPHPADLQAPDPPRVNRNNVVDDEGHLAVGGDVPVLPARGHVVAGDVDDAQLGIAVKSDRADLKRPAGLGGSQPAQPLGRKVVDLCLGEGHGGSDYGHGAIAD